MAAAVASHALPLPGGASAVHRQDFVAPAAIGRAVGVDADIDPEARMDMARRLGAFKTSMLQDMEAGKRLEIDGLLTGTLVVAKKAGVAAPFTESLAGLARLRAESTGQYP